MEQGPEELSDRPDERAEDLRKLTDEPLDADHSGDGEDESSEDDPEPLDPGP